MRSKKWQVITTVKLDASALLGSDMLTRQRDAATQTRQPRQSVGRAHLSEEEVERH
jgi:hypothetical protein